MRGKAEIIAEERRNMTSLVSLAGHECFLSLLGSKPPGVSAIIYNGWTIVVVAWLRPLKGVACPCRC